MAGEVFARDLGYLDGFFDKLEAHAATLGPAESARLKILMGEERKRWTEIRALIAGGKAAPQAAGAPGVAAPPAAAPARAVSYARPGPLTVGSLIGR